VTVKYTYSRYKHNRNQKDRTVQSAFQQQERTFVMTSLFDVDDDDDDDDAMEMM